MAEAPREEINEAFEQDETVRIARIGIEIDAAKNSPLGRLIIERARSEARDARDELVTVDITDTKRLLELQLAARMGDAIEQWIKEAIERGQVAEALIREEDSEEGAGE